MVYNLLLEQSLKQTYTLPPKFAMTPNKPTQASQTTSEPSNFASEELTNALCRSDLFSHDMTLILECRWRASFLRSVSPHTAEWSDLGKARSTVIRSRADVFFVLYWSL